MDTRVFSEFGVKGAGEMLLFLNDDGKAIMGGENLGAWVGLDDLWGANEDGVELLCIETELTGEGLSLASVGVAGNVDV